MPIFWLSLIWWEKGYSPKYKLISLSPLSLVSLSLSCTCNQMLIEMMQPTRTLLHVTIQSIDTSGTVVWIWWLYSPFIYMDLIWTGSVVVYARNLILINFLIVKWQHKIMYLHKIVCEWQFHEVCWPQFPWLYTAINNAGIEIISAFPVLYFRNFHYKSCDHWFILFL